MLRGVTWRVVAELEEKAWIHSKLVEVRKLIEKEQCVEVKCRRRIPGKRVES